MKKVKSRSQFTSNPPASSRTKERSLERKSKPLVRDRSESGTDLSNVRIKDKQSKLRIASKTLSSLKLAADDEKTPKNLKEET